MTDVSKAIVLESLENDRAYWARRAGTDTASREAKCASAFAGAITALQPEAELHRKLGAAVLAAIDDLELDTTRQQKLRYMKTNACHGFHIGLYDAIFDALDSHKGYEDA